MENLTDGLFGEMTRISKAHAYDIIQPQVIELKTENERLRNRVKELENLIAEYADKMKQNLQQ